MASNDARTTTHTNDTQRDLARIWRLFSWAKPLRPPGSSAGTWDGVRWVPPETGNSPSVWVDPKAMRIRTIGLTQYWNGHGWSPYGLGELSIAAKKTPHG